LKLSREARVAVVTGASSGFGEATARLLASMEWHPILLARRVDRLEEIAGEIDADYYQCDITDADQVYDAAAAISEEHEHIDLLVNNAGIGIANTFLGADEEGIEDTVQTNYLGPVRVTRAFFNLLQRGSDVVNVASAAGTSVLPTSGPYSASKHALVAASRALACEFRPTGVDVHTVLPGFAETEGFPQEDRLPAPFKWRFMQTTPEAVAEAIVDRIGTKSGESYIPRIYRLGAIAANITPMTSARVLDWLFRDYRPAA